MNQSLKSRSFEPQLKTEERVEVDPDTGEKIRITTVRRGILVVAEHGLVLDLARDQDDALVEEVCEHARRNRPRILGLDVKDTPQMTDVVVVAQQGATVGLGHGKQRIIALPTAKCATEER